MRKFLFVLLLALVCSAGASAQALCQWRDTLTNSIGQVIPGATVIVLAGTVGGSAAVNTNTQPGTPLATIYADPYGLVPINQTTNPINTASGDGTFQFWATCGLYVVIQAYGPQIAGQYVYSIRLSGSSAGGVPGGNTSQLQFNSAGTFGGAPGITTSDGSNLTIKGPIPFVDVSSFARSVSSVPQATATCTATQNTCTFNTVAGFQIGDGVTIRGRGANLAIGTPSTSGFTVTPSLSSGGMGLGGGNYASLTTVASATGASTYNYELIARDQVGGYTAPSSPVTIATGQATLGGVTCAVSTATRSGVLETITFSAPCVGAVVGAAFSFFGSTSATFSGFYNVQTVNSSSQIVVSGPYNSTTFGFQPGDSTQNSATGGTATFVLSNHLAWTLGSPAPWQYYVCAERPGDVSYKLIGITKPNTSAGQDTQFDDYGSPYNDNQLYPTYISNSLCNGGAAQNDPTTSTILNIVGTTVTLSDTATNSTAVTNGAIFDDAPGFLAAMNTLGNGRSGTLLIPWTTNGSAFYINSYFKLPQQVSVRQIGTLVTHETVEFGMQNWDGGGSSTGVEQFAYDTTGGAFWSCTAVPCVYMSVSGFRLENIRFNIAGNTNGGLIELDEADPVIRRNIQYTVEGGTNGYLGTAIWYRLVSASSYSNFHLQNSLITVANTSGTTWAPIFYVPIPQTNTGTPANAGLNALKVFIENSDWSIRGFQKTSANPSPSVWSFKNVTRQAGRTPLLWLQASNNRDFEEVILDHITQDTDISGTVAYGNMVGGPGLSQVDIFAQDVNMSSSDTGGQVPPFMGTLPREVEQRYNSTGRMPHVGIGTCPSQTNAGGGTYIRCDYDSTLFTGPNAEIFFPLAQPTAPTATIAAGGSLAASLTLTAGITAVGVDGKETVISPSSATTSTSGTCPGSGNCEVSLTWTAVPYAASYNVYGCTATVGPTCPALAKQASSITTNSYSWTTLVNLGSPPAITLAGQSGRNAVMSWAPKFACPENAAPSGVANFDLLYCDSTSHSINEINGSGLASPLTTNATLAGGTLPVAATTVTASGIVDGQTHTVVTTSASPSLADGYSKTIANNQEATAGAAVTYTLPAAVAGLTKCVINSNNGSAPDTGVLTLQTSGSGQYIIFTDGTLSASGGYVSSGGAAADNACVQGVDATHWQLFVQSGTWAKH